MEKNAEDPDKEDFIEKGGEAYDEKSGVSFPGRYFYKNVKIVIPILPEAQADLGDVVLTQWM